MKRNALRVLSLTLLALTVAADARSADADSAGRLRRPEALLAVDGGRLLTANRGTGTISVVDVAAKRVVAEAEVGRGLADLKELPKGRWLLAVDQATGELLLLERQGDAIRRVSAIAVASDPARVVVGTDGLRALVVSRWSRQLTFLAWDQPASADEPPVIRVVKTLGLPFSPLDAAVLPGESPSLVVVADAFGGNLALIDQDKATCESAWHLPAHNMRALTISHDGETLAILGQNVSPQARTSLDDVHWGLIIRSRMQTLRVQDLRTAGITTEALLTNGQTVGVSNIGRGSADPAALALGRAGEVVVAIAGVDEVASALGLGEPYERLKVGRRPSALILSPDARTAYTADTLDDTVSVVDLEAGKVPATISLGARPRPTLIEAGERLFSDARIGQDGWMSCQSCHTDGHTAGIVADTQGDGSYGAAKRTPSLLGVGSTGPWGWLGTFDRLEDQVRQSIETTMRGSEPTAEQVEALTAYLASLSPPPPLPSTADEPAIARGRAVFAAQKCNACHAPPHYTSPKTYDVGLTDAVGNQSFNPPSLLGLSRRPALLHDASARSPHDLLTQDQHPGGTVLTADEVDDLVRFLESL